FLALLFFVSAIPAFSQSQLPDAHVSGTLTDPSGAGIGGVRVAAQLEGKADTQLWSATSATDGAYHLSLPPGRYVVHFSRDPFAPREFTWDLSSGESRTLDLRLELERLSSSVVVTAEAEPVLRPESTAPTDVITREVIDQRQSVAIPDLLLFSHRGTTRIPSVTLFGEGGSYANGHGGGQISGVLGAFDYSGAASYLQ